MLVVALIMTLKNDEERLSDMEEEQEENIHNKPETKYGKPKNIKDMKYTMRHCERVGFSIGLPDILESSE